MEENICLLLNQSENIFSLRNIKLTSALMLEIREHIQQEVTPALQVGLVAVGPQQVEGSGAPVEGWVVEVVD